MRRLLVCSVGLIAGASGAFAQSAKPAFEVASMKLATPGGSFVGCTGGPGSSDPTHFTCPNAPLGMLLTIAWNIKFSQYSGPDWTNTQAYAVQAVVPAGVTRPQMNRMLQTLLEERLRLTFHEETKDLSAYSLTTMKNVHLTESSPSAEVKGSEATSVVGDHWRYTAQKQSMKSLAGYLSVRLQTEIADDTGFAGLFDFTLDFLPPGANSPTASGQGALEPTPDLLTALQSQLGLRLVARTLPMEFLVIDHAERIPVAN
jgi:uncharacterized protein (TIGR03435 family)